MITFVKVFYSFFLFFKEIPLFPGMDCPHESETIKSLENTCLFGSISNLEKFAQNNFVPTLYLILYINL